jgi:hypothetical protein
MYAILPAAAQPQVAPPATITVPKADGDGTYTVKWGASPTAAVRYILQEATDASFSKVRRFSPTKALRMKITRRRSGKTYYYRVMAIKAGWPNSDWRTGGNGCAVPGALKVKPPANITVPASDADGNYTVNWGRSRTSGARYVLEEATAPDFSQGLQVVYCGPALSAAINGRVHKPVFS